MQNAWYNDDVISGLQIIPETFNTKVLSVLGISICKYSDKKQRTRKLLVLAIMEVQYNFAIAKLLFAMASFPWVLLILTWILTGWKHSTDSTEINYNFQVSNISTLWSRSLQKFW